MVCTASSPLAVVKGLIEMLPLFLTARVVCNCVNCLANSCCDRTLTVGFGLLRFGVYPGGRSSDNGGGFEIGSWVPGGESLVRMAGTD